MPNLSHSSGCFGIDHRLGWKDWGKRVDSVLACQEVCFSDPKCNSFTWHTKLEPGSPGYCATFKVEVSRSELHVVNVNKWNQLGQYISGPKDCGALKDTLPEPPIPSSFLKIIPDCFGINHWHGWAPNGVYTEDSIACQAECQARPKCRSFTWFSEIEYRHPGYCAMLETELNKYRLAIVNVNMKTQRYMYISGPKICKPRKKVAIRPPIRGKGWLYYTKSCICFLLLKKLSG